MADLKMPEVNSVILSGNLTRDPSYRKTTGGASVINFTVAMNKKYRDAANKWQEQVCYVGVVAWNKLAESCAKLLKKGSPVLIDGELQSHYFKSENGTGRSVIEVKARRIQFLSKRSQNGEATLQDAQTEEETNVVEDDSFERFLSQDELMLLRETDHNNLQPAHEMNDSGDHHHTTN
ncbi:MAG: single-stranded DNA-binding protein [Bacteroidetes bacterium]|nr:MAG: single-stranded DNA-binding protein [Bacteroidota bacterium]